MNASVSPTGAAKAEPFEPVVVAFVCTYCSYTAADLAGALRLEYPANVRIIKMTCTGKTDPLVLLRAFEKGADAVFVAGCMEGDCHFIRGNIQGKKWVCFTKQKLEEIGLETDRLEFFHVAASDAAGWVDAVSEMTQRARRLGPSPFNQEGSKRGKPDEIPMDKESAT